MLTPHYAALLLLIHIPTAVARSSREHLIREGVSSWCDLHPYGKIFSDSNYFICSHELEDWEELRVKNLRMKGIKLQVGIIPDKNSYDYDCGGYYEQDDFKPKPGYSYYILNLLKEILGFDIEFVLTDTWGTFDEKGNNWTGLVGLAERNVIDLGICHTTITEDREDQVDFLLSTLSSTIAKVNQIVSKKTPAQSEYPDQIYSNTYIHFFMQQTSHLWRSFIYDPSKLPLTRDVFVLTFSPLLWLSFFASVILLVICFRISTWTHSKLRPDHESWSWIEVILWAIAAICQQSYSRHPKGSSCRTTFLIGYLITYLLYTGFAAGVTSHLAVQGYNARLDFEDVVLMKLNLVTQSDGSHLDFIKDSPDPYAKSLYSNLFNLIKRNQVGTLQELFTNIKEENFVGLGTTVALHNFLMRKIPAELKRFTMADIYNSYHQKAFVLQKKSPFKETFNYWILRLMEAGLLDFGEKEYIQTDDIFCCQQPGWSSAGLGNVLSAVIIYGGGLFLSLVILFVEIAWREKYISSEWEILSRREVQNQLMGKKMSILRQENIFLG